MAVKAGKPEYVFGKRNEDKCPAKSGRISGELACKRAAAALGKRYDGSVDSSPSPSGCYNSSSDGVAFFKSQKPGSKTADQRLLCATGAPPRPAPPSLYPSQPGLPHSSAMAHTHSAMARVLMRMNSLRPGQSYSI